MQTTPTRDAEPTDFRVVQDADGTWSVRCGGDVMLSGVTNARAYAWVDRNRLRPLWKPSKSDFWGR